MGAKKPGKKKPKKKKEVIALISQKKNLMRT
jgi:hypothetical protein